MSSLTGLAQFTNRFAQNIMGYEEGKRKEAERVADKEYNRSRQEAIDTRAQESHDLSQQQGNVNLQSGQLALEQGKTKNKQLNDQNNYSATVNQVKQLKAIGADESQSIDVIMNSVNSHSNLPYTLKVERGQDGKVIARKDQDGNTFYYQSIIDKETGEELGRKATTVDDMMNSYTQLQRGGAIEEEQQAAIAARQAKQQEIQDKLTLKTGEAKIEHAKYADNKAVDVDAYAINKGVDHNYAMATLGVKNTLELEKLAIQHGYRLEELDRGTVNRIAQGLAQSDIDSGGTPIVGGNGPAWGSFDALIGPESNGQQLNSKGQPLTSSAGAIGIAQVMPDTAKYVASKHGIAWDANRYKTDPDYNYNLGKLYYQEQLNKYKHPALAYAAYNAGPGAVDKWIKRNPAMANPDVMGMDNFVKAIPFKETRNYVAKIHRQSSGLQVKRSVPAIPKGAGKSSKQANSGKGIVTVQDYNANIDKGVDTALKGVKNLGIKSDAATTATYARAGTKLKEMGKARSEQEFLDLYGEAFDLVISAVPERKRNKMSKADQNALGHKVLLSMVGASSLGNLKQIVYNINPSARGAGTSKPAGGYMLPGQQPKTAKTTPQTGKLKALYARGLPAPKTDPATSENIKSLENLSLDMDW